MAEQADALLDAAHTATAGLLDELRTTNASTSVATRVAGATVLAAKIGPSSLPPGGGDVMLPVEGTSAEVALPASLFDGLGLQQEVAIAVTVFDPSNASGAAAGSRVAAAVNIDLLSLSSSAPISVSGLADPIKISLPVNLSAGLACAFWDEQRQAWSTDGLRISPGTNVGEPLVCETTHLSLFGAIAEGFVSALVCSQVTLLKEGSMGALLEGDWYARGGAVALWVVLAMLVATFLAGALLDWWRGSKAQAAWSDENFLVPLYHGPAKDGEVRSLGDGSSSVSPVTWDSLGSSRWSERKDAREQEARVIVAGIDLAGDVGAKGARVVEASSRRARAESPTRVESPEPAARSVTTGTAVDSQAEELEGRLHAEEGDGRGRARRCCCAAVACCAAAGSGLRESSAVRDAIDDILSRWVSFFGEIRDFVEGFYEGLDLGGIGLAQNAVCMGRLRTLIDMMMASMVISSSRRLTGASLMVSDKVVCFILHDEELAALVVSSHDDHVAPRNGEGDRQRRRRRFSSNGALPEVWTELHESLSEQIHRHVSRHSSILSLPRVFAGLFFIQNPIGAALVFDIFASCKMRAMFLALEMLGGLVLCTVFFSASGSIGGKRSHSNCTSTSAWTQVGRLLAICLVSIFVSGLPVAFLQSLHSRGFKKLEYEGCPAWERQLRVWRIQDRAIWVLGSTYLAGCTFFLCLVLANIDARDHKNWVVGAMITVAEDAAIIPFAVALALPILTMIFISINGWVQRRKKSQLLWEMHRKLHADTNTMLPIVSV